MMPQQPLLSPVLASLVFSRQATEPWAVLATPNPPHFHLKHFVFLPPVEPPPPIILIPPTNPPPPFPPPPTLPPDPKFHLSYSPSHPDPEYHPSNPIHHQFPSHHALSAMHPSHASSHSPPQPRSASRKSYPPCEAPSVIVPRPDRPRRLCTFATGAIGAHFWSCPRRVGPWRVRRVCRSLMRVSCGILLVCRGILLGLAWLCRRGLLILREQPF
mmetsp:Transcript_34921/g.73648  ORF Transcript_34921/g.73648 Transcript_34921/m.73648 type:complete len:215 (+) Transcript_34921:210-854(+)